MIIINTKSKIYSLIFGEEGELAINNSPQPFFSHLYFPQNGFVNAADRITRAKPTEDYLVLRVRIRQQCYPNYARKLARCNIRKGTKRVPPSRLQFSSGCFGRFPNVTIFTNVLTESIVNTLKQDKKNTFLSKCKIKFIPLVSLSILVDSLSNLANPSYFTKSISSL